MMFLFCIGLGLEDRSAYAAPTLPITSEQEKLTIEVYPQQHRLVVKSQDHTIKVYPVSVGTPLTPTPVGEYRIRSKGKNWGPSFGPRWLGLDVPWGIYGIHGTNKVNSIGQHLSHGCIRMRNQDILKLFDLIPIGTKVTIYGHVLGELLREPRKLAEGDVGVDVLLIQSRLKSAGYFSGSCNGKFRASTTDALKRFQRDHNLIQDGIVSNAVYDKIGLLE
ncbi:L,D-transpeptidase family protein [Cohnella herbarum]